MKIQDPLIEPYEIHMDEHQYILVKKSLISSGPKKGTIRHKSIKFYANIEHCIKPLIRMLTERDKRIVSLSEYLQEYKITKARLEKLILNVFGD